MNAKKLFMLTFAIFLILAGSAAAWFFFWHDLPKKTPLRAKQVMLFHLETAGAVFSQSVRLLGCARHKSLWPGADYN